VPGWLGGGCQVSSFRTAFSSTKVKISVCLAFYTILKGHPLHSMRCRWKCIYGGFLHSRHEVSELCCCLLPPCGIVGILICLCLDPTDHLDEVVVGVSQPMTGVPPH
jgi:hypothetical protein